VEGAEGRGDGEGREEPGGADEPSEGGGEGGKKKDSLGKSRQRARLPRSAAAASIGGGMTFLYYLYCSRYFTSFVAADEADSRGLLDREMREKRPVRKA
jgi:hypothetical protein